MKDNRSAVHPVTAENTGNKTNPPPRLLKRSPASPNQKTVETSKRPKTTSEIIKVDCLARVEGEGALYIKIHKNQIQDLKFRIYEPPRFFEAFLRGRNYSEVPDITARICGICPIAYQMSSVQALEKAFGITVPMGLQELRRLLYCGEWIESHALHVVLLHAPDFLGYEDGIRMAKDHPHVVQMGLKIKKAGNDIVNLLGGREIHPINVKVGGFYFLPSRKELNPVVENLKWAREHSLELAKWCARLPIPNYEDDYEFVALQHPTQYPLNEGLIASNKGLRIEVEEYENHFQEEQVEHSTSLHSRLKERGPYLVGPAARYALNYDRLSVLTRETAKEIGFPRVCNNPFASIVIRALETLYACDEALRILKNYETLESPAIPVEPKAAVGHGCTEAPRGILYHRYKVNAEGIVEEAKIVPPTSQNQTIIERDLFRFVERNLHLNKEKLTWQCEQMIRNYDPCISCSCHFLKLTMDQS